MDASRSPCVRLLSARQGIQYPLVDLTSISWDQVRSSYGACRGSGFHEGGTVSLRRTWCVPPNTGTHDPLGSVSIMTHPGLPTSVLGRTGMRVTKLGYGAMELRGTVELTDRR